jgi:methyltransferase (TIGR00027 family)
MHKGRTSETASQAAVLRAAHLALDDPPIFNDHLAGPLSGIPEPAAVLAALSTLERVLAQWGPPGVVKAWMQAARLSVVVRALWAEEQLLQEVERTGLSQYVILGAGLDSFAYRRPDLASVLRVFEVDHPATQAHKRARLGELGIEIPPHVTFVPIDFEHQAILDVLQETGYRREQPAFFSWLGVPIYLTGEAIDRTLGQIASAANGSEIVLNYVVPPHLLGEEDRQVVRMLESLIASSGEPGRSYFEPAQLEARVRALGFTNVWHLGPKEATARYLANRADGLRVSPLVNLLKAQV